MAIYLSRLHYQHAINIYRVKEMEVMRNNNNQLRHISPFFYLLRQDIYCSDIKSCIDLIEKNTLWIKESNLKHLYASFFSSGESDIEITIEKLGIKSIFWKHFFYHSPEDKRSGCLHIWVFECEMVRIDRSKIFE